MRFAFASEEQARKAIVIAKRIHPEAHWYLTNERGPWEVVRNQYT